MNYCRDAASQPNDTRVRVRGRRASLSSAEAWPGPASLQPIVTRRHSDVGSAVVRAATGAMEPGVGCPGTDGMDIGGMDAKLDFAQ